jgi:aminomethyltransferase
VKKTALTDLHISLGARMTEFAGFLMPVSYSGIQDEHDAVRRAAGIFDVSHMGEFIMKGPHALALIQRLTTNDASRLSPGKAQYTCLTNEHGGIVDDLILYCLPDQAWMLVVNAANIEKDWNHICRYNTDQVEMHNISDRCTLLAVQGPRAGIILQKLTDIDLSKIAFYHFVKGQLAGVNNVLISNTGYTGSGGFEIYFEHSHSLHIWNQIVAAGQDEGLKPCGLGARDTLRLEMGFCLYGNDIDEHTSPLEAGLEWIVKFNKSFIASDILQKQKEEGVRQKLVSFEMIDKGIPRKGYDIYLADGNQIGRVTSGTHSHWLNKSIGMGYVKSEYARLGENIFISHRSQLLKACIVKPPFYKSSVSF